MEVEPARRLRHDELVGAVAVDVAGGEREPEVTAGDRRRFGQRQVGIAERPAEGSVEDVDRAGLGDATDRLVADADREIVGAVVVEVAGGEGAAEVVPGLLHRGVGARPGLADVPGVGHAEAARSAVDHRDGSRLGAPVEDGAAGVFGNADGQVLIEVVVEVADREGAAEVLARRRIAQRRQLVGGFVELDGAADREPLRGRGRGQRERSEREDPAAGGHGSTARTGRLRGDDHRSLLRPRRAALEERSRIGRESGRRVVPEREGAAIRAASSGCGAPPRPDSSAEISCGSGNQRSASTSSGSGSGSTVGAEAAAAKIAPRLVEVAGERRLRAG